MVLEDCQIDWNELIIIPKQNIQSKNSRQQNSTGQAYGHSEAYDEITYSLNRAFALPSLKSYAQTWNIQGLMTKSVEMFVGSRNVPKNIQLSRFLLELAAKRAKDQKQKDQVQYYKYFFLRIDAFKTGKKEQFDMTSQALNNLAEENEHPQSCYLTGKQILNIATSLQGETKKEAIKLATIYFQKSITDTTIGGIYYLGYIFQTIENNDLSQQEIQEFFILGASLGDPLCYFSLALMHKQKQRHSLYIKYLKLAAEGGIIEAQHNLGCEYLQGKIVKKNDVKALGWFVHAGANGYIESKYNAAQMFLNGSSCGKIKPNTKAALLKLEELRTAGEDVEDKIKQLLNRQEIKKIADDEGNK